MFFQPCSCVSSGLTLIPAKIVSWQRSGKTFDYYYNCLLLISVILFIPPSHSTYHSSHPFWSSLSSFSFLLLIPLANSSHRSSLHIFHSLCSSLITHSSHPSSSPFFPSHSFCSSSFTIRLIHPSHNAVSIPSLLVIPLVLLINVPHSLTHLLLILVTHY
jgi:hypothetical protein